MDLVTLIKQFEQKQKMKKSNTVTNTKKNNKKSMPKVAAKKATVPTVLNFKRTTVCPNIEQTSPNNYRARLSLGGKPYTFNTKFLNKAKTWVKASRKAGVPTV